MCLCVNPLPSFPHHLPFAYSFAFNFFNFFVYQTLIFIRIFALTFHAGTDGRQELWLSGARLQAVSKVVGMCIYLRKAFA